MGQICHKYDHLLTFAAEDILCYFLIFVKYSETFGFTIVCFSARCFGCGFSVYKFPVIAFGDAVSRYIDCLVATFPYSCNIIFIVRFVFIKIHETAACRIWPVIYQWLERIAYKSDSNNEDYGGQKCQPL